jgi:hypothetical protein
MTGGSRRVGTTSGAHFAASHVCFWKVSGD